MVRDVPALVLKPGMTWIRSPTECDDLCPLFQVGGPQSSNFPFIVAVAVVVAVVEELKPLIIVVTDRLTTMSGSIQMLARLITLITAPRP